MAAWLQQRDVPDGCAAHVPFRTSAAVAACRIQGPRRPLATRSRVLCCIGSCQEPATTDVIIASWRAAGLPERRAGLVGEHAACFIRGCTTPAQRKLSGSCVWAVGGGEGGGFGGFGRGPGGEAFGCCSQSVHGAAIGGHAGGSKLGAVSFAVPFMR